MSRSVSLPSCAPCEGLKLEFVFADIFKMNVDPDSLIPKLPNPRDLQPFPNSPAILYMGHTDKVTCLSIDPTGQWLATGSFFNLFCI